MLEAPVGRCQHEVGPLIDIAEEAQQAQIIALTAAHEFDRVLEVRKPAASVLERHRALERTRITAHARDQHRRAAHLR